MRSVATEEATTDSVFSYQEPIRGELCGQDAMEERARQLASIRVRVNWYPAGASLLHRFRENGRVLREAHRRIASVSRGREPLTPVAEWLLDNFYVIEEVLREVQQDLPRGFYKELPKLTTGPLARYPRIYA